MTPSHLSRPWPFRNALVVLVISLGGYYLLPGRCQLLANPLGEIGQGGCNVVPEPNWAVVVATIETEQTRAPGPWK